jgi:hypothetical protein
MRSRTIASRTLCAALLLTLAAAATIAIGVSLALGGTSSGAAGSGSSAPRPQPDPQFERGLEEAREQERRRAAQRRSPEATEERRRSRRAFRGLNAAEAQGVARRHHARTLLAPVAAAFRPRANERIKRYLSDHNALVEVGGGKAHTLVTTTLPLRVGEDEQPFSLELRDRGAAYESENPMSRVRIAKRAGDGVTLPSGLSFAPVGGDGETASIVEDKAFFANVSADVDYVVEPTVGGAEAMWHLRSEEATQTPALVFDLPAGARIDDNPAVPGGLLVVRGDDKLAAVAPPAAWDADDEPIPTKYEIDGNKVVVRVDHRERDVRYPILVDPNVTDHLSWGGPGCLPRQCYSYDGWHTAASGPFDFAAPGEGWWWRYPGLFSWAPQYTWFGSNSWGDWRFPAFRQSHIFRADLRAAHDPSYSHLIQGIWGNGGWEGTWHHPGQGENTAPWQPSHRFEGTPVTVCAYRGCGWEHGTTGNWVTQGLFLPGGLYASKQATGVLEVAAVAQWDRNDPEIRHVSGGPPANWVRGGSYPLTVEGYDAGLGISRVGFGGSNFTQERPVGCTGATENRCPDRRPETFNIDTAGFSEGVHTLTAFADDIILRPRAHRNYTLRIDRTAPAITSFANGAVKPGAFLPSGRHQLRVDAADTGPGGAESSGVRRIEYQIDGGAWIGVDKACGSGPCDQSWTIDTTATGLTEGRHTLTARAWDRADIPGESSFSFVVDRTAPVIKEAAGPLRDTAIAGGKHELWITAADEAIAADAAGVDRVEVQVTDPASTERVVNAGQGERPTYTFDATAAAEGRHRFALRAVDRAGNVTLDAQRLRFEVIVDRGQPELPPPGGTLPPEAGTTLAPGSYTLTANATDGATTNAASERSGARDIEFWVDGAMVQRDDQDCPSGSCSLQSRTYTFDTSQHAGGEHLIEIYAHDQLDHERKHTFRVLTAGRTHPVSSWAVSANPLLYDVTYGDVSGDGFPDLVQRNRADGEVAVGVSDGTRFGTPVPWSGLGFWIGRDLRTGDVDGDGDAELIGRDDLNRIYVATSTGSSFGNASEWATSGGEYYLADADGDLQVDLFTRDTSTGAVVVLYSHPDGTSWGQSHGVMTVDPARRLAVPDVNDDGLADLVSRDTSSGAVSVALAGDTDYEAPTQWGTTSTDGDIAFLDLTGDGQDDLVTRDGSGLVRAARSNGSGFQPPEDWGTLPAGYDFNLIDLDGDYQGDVVGRNAMGDVSALRSNITPPLDELPDFVPEPGALYDPSDPFAAEPVSRPAAATATRASALDENPVCPEGKALQPTQNQGLVAQSLPLGVAADAQFGVIQSGARPDCNRYVMAMARAAQVGSRTVRLFVYWRTYMTNTDYQEKVILAIRRARAANQKVLASLTGWSGDSGSNVFVVPANNQFTKAHPQIDEYRKFVEKAVTDMSAEGVREFSIWNEPNLIGQPWLKAECPAGTVVAAGNFRRSTMDLYRVLYQVGAEAVKQKGGPDAKVYIGELAAPRQPGWYSNCNGTGKRNKTFTADYLARVANSTSEPLRTDGVAWHPYQQCADPTVARSGCPFEKDNMGIGRIETMQRTIGRLGGKELKAYKNGGTPNLLLTEFGYLNKPVPAYEKKRGHSEAREQDWYVRAFRKAVRPGGGKHGARLFILYGMIHLRNDTDDTGTVRDSLTFPHPGTTAHAFGTVDPDYTRGYGTGGPNQALRAFCRGLRRWAVDKQYRPVYDFAEPVAKRPDDATCSD